MSWLTLPGSGGQQSGQAGEVVGGHVQRELSTDAGQTECFLVPILNRLARASAKGLPRLSGVRALVIYPLNALINSQRERLSDWTSPFEGRIRFCLYNGETLEKMSRAEREARAEEVRDRETLRKDPPQILVTNITMLEYMLIRSIDQPIIEASQGKLEYIVLDEAHTYVGSQAAELALLLRRVTQAFGVEASKVRFVATSATIGSEGDTKTSEELRRFLADIGGVPESRVHVVEGSRVTPPLPAPQPGLALPTLSELADLDPAGQFTRLAATPLFRKANDELRARPAKVSEWAERLGLGSEACERLLEVAANARAQVNVAGRTETHALLPLRVHAFHRTEPGFFACINPGCRGRAGTKLDHPAWRYGAVFHERIERCPDCRSLVLELQLCSNCGNETLTAERVSNTDATEQIRLPAMSAVDDEFEDDLVDGPPPDGESESANASDATKADMPDRANILLTASGSGKPCAIERTSGKVLETSGTEAVLLRASDGVICPSCDATLRGRGTARLYPLRLGAPFLLGNIIPELLEDASIADAARQSGAPLRFRPADGKQLLTFTDSRQGTARLSAKLQAEAERSYVRAFIYHTVQDAAAAGGNAAELAAIDAVIAQLDAALKQSPAPVIKQMLDEKRSERERVSKPKGISWSRMIDLLAADRTVQYLRQSIWQERDAKLLASDRELAKLFMLREFFRRPRRANSAETLGLARLTAPAIEALTEISVPREFRKCGGTLQDWKDFLAVALTWFVRANSLVMVNSDLKRRFIHRRIPTGILIAPGTDRTEASQRPWPHRASQGGRLALITRLLMRGLNLDIADPGQQHDTEATLLKAWDVIRLTLQPGNSGYQLDFEKLELMALESAWLCPVTKRVLDRTFRALSPYLSMDGFVPATPILLPRLPFPFGLLDGREAAPEAIEAWLQDDERVVAGRARGTWGNLHDAIARRRNFFRAAEHSAQQPAWRLIASKNAIVNAYAFYVRGRRLGVAKPELDAVIARWIFGSLLTARYSGSSESAFEQDLSRLTRAGADSFTRELDKALLETLTGDYWTLTLVSTLATQKARAPVALAFRAAQVVLGARALFSDQLLQNLLDPPAERARAAEPHHLFPIKWLRSRGISDRRQINQVANLADVGWNENSEAGSGGPATYVPRLREKLGIDDDRWGRMCAEHALPLSWERMDYQEFLGERRKRMADIIHVAFRQLGGEVDAAPLTPPWFLLGAEDVWKRIAVTERVLRALVREVYAHRFGDAAAAKIEEGLQEFEREALKRATRARPQGADPLSVVDYLYLGQLPRLLFADAVWQEVKSKFAHVNDLKRRLQSAMGQIAPVRNEIAHVREVSQERLLRTTVACNDVIEMLTGRVGG